MSAAITSLRVHSLSSRERVALQRALAVFHYPAHGPYWAYIARVRAIVADCLESASLRELDRLKNDPRACGALLLEGCPFDPAVQRGLLPGELAISRKAGSLSEGLLVGVVSQMGEPYGVRQEGAGLVNEICPSPEHVGQLTGLGSRLALGLHIENAAARVQPGDRAPEGLALIGVSREPGSPVGTLLADGQLALRLCPPSVEMRLRRPEFRLRAPLRWGAERTEIAPVVSGPAAAPTFTAAFYGDLVEGTNIEAARALAEFREALEAIAVAAVIEPGSLLLIDNRRMFHGRAGFQASFDASGRPYRWLQRVFWTTSMRRFGSWPRVSDRVVRAELATE